MCGIVDSPFGLVVHTFRFPDCVHYLKTFTTKEGVLRKMRRRRKSLVSKADSLDNSPTRSVRTTGTFDDMRTPFQAIAEKSTLNSEIMDEEADLGEWRRAGVREWMGVLSGGLLECSEKGAVVVTFGRSVTERVSTGMTQAGPPLRTLPGETFVVETERELDKISFVGEVGGRALQPLNGFCVGNVPGLPPLPPNPPIRPTPTHPPRSYAPLTSQQPTKQPIRAW